MGILSSILLVVDVAPALLIEFVQHSLRFLLSHLTLSENG